MYIAGAITLVVLHLLLWTALDPRLEVYLEYVLLFLMVAGGFLLIYRCFKLLVLWIKQRQSPFPLKKLIFHIGGLSFIFLNGFMLLLANIFPPVLAKTVEIQNHTFFVMDHSFLDPACSVRIRRYVFWSREIVPFSGGCIPYVVQIRKDKNQLVVQMGSRIKTFEWSEIVP